MAELAASCLVAEGARVTLVANRTYERARAIAEQLGARALTLDEAWSHFADTDIALCSTAAPHAVVTWERVAPAIAGRGGRPLCILDLAVPRDVEPAVGQLENVFLYDVDDLQAVAGQAAAQRRGEIPAAEGIVNDIEGSLATVGNGERVDRSPRSQTFGKRRRRFARRQDALEASRRRERVGVRHRRLPRMIAVARGLPPAMRPASRGAWRTRSRPR